MCVHERECELGLGVVGGLESLGLKLVNMCKALDQCLVQCECFNNVVK